LFFCLHVLARHLRASGEEARALCSSTRSSEHLPEWFGIIGSSSHQRKSARFFLLLLLEHTVERALAGRVWDYRFVVEYTSR